VALRDELGKLDSEVAAGRISAEEFRAQRDHLLASAGSGPVTGGPFPPPYRWGERTDGEPTDTDERTRTVPRAAPAEDRTEVVTRRSVPAGERTQVVPRRTGPRHAGPSAAAPSEEHTQVVRRPSDAGRTQVVRNGAVRSGYSTVGAPPWARGPAMTPPSTAAPNPLRPNPLRPEGTLPPWTLNQQISPSTRTSGYGNGAAFRATRPHGWLRPAAVVLAVLLIVALVLGIVLYVVR